VIGAERIREVVRRRTTGVYFVGYPKTGNTWTRFLVGRYFERVCGLPEPPLFDSYDGLGRCQRACQGPGMHFTHAPLEWSSQTATDLSPRNVLDPFRRSAVVLIVRYPLDVLVSSYMQQRHRTDEGYDAGLEAFMEDPVFGLDKLLRFHQIWATARERPRPIRLLRYEDLHADAPDTIRGVLSFVGVEPDEAAVAEAVERSSFSSMRRLELSGAPPRYRSSGLEVFATGDPHQPDALHVRKGTVGGYRDELDDETAATLEARVAEGMPAWYGYSTPPSAEPHVD
jgi:alcohol sulfotransferase